MCVITTAFCRNHLLKSGDFYCLRGLDLCLWRNIYGVDFVVRIEIG